MIIAGASKRSVRGGGRCAVCARGNAARNNYFLSFRFSRRAAPADPITRGTDEIIILVAFVFESASMCICVTAERVSGEVIIYFCSRATDSRAVLDEAITLVDFLWTLFPQRQDKDISSFGLLSKLLFS